MYVYICVYVCVCVSVCVYVVFVGLASKSSLSSRVLAYQTFSLFNINS